MSMTLYQLSEKYENALKELMANDDIPAEALFDTKELMQSEVMLKGQNVAAVFLNLDAECEAIKSAITRMKDRLSRREKKMNWLKFELQTAMERCDINEISCPEFCIKLQKNPEKVVIDDEMLLSPEYFTKNVSITPDKVKIKESIKDGVAVAGAHLESTMRLAIK